MAVFPIKNGRHGRYKWFCPKTTYSKTSLGCTRVCNCEEPCTDSKYGRVTYTYPSKDLRLYPGSIRGTDEWNSIYKIRVVVEKAINHMKSNMAISGRKTRNAKTTKADVFLAGIAQLFTVIIADNMAKPEYIRSIKRLVC